MQVHTQHYQNIFVDLLHAADSRSLSHTLALMHILTDAPANYRSTAVTLVSM